MEMTGTDHRQTIGIDNRHPQSVAGAARARRRLGVRQGRRRKRRGRDLFRPRKIQRPDARPQFHRGRFAQADGVSAPARRERLRHVQHARFANELADAEKYLRAIIAAGVDAAIVQDVGICRLIRRLSPDFPIHASTQMTVTSAAGVEFARELGCNLVVLARECSIKEIEKITPANFRRATLNHQLPLEVLSTARCAWPIPANV
jgi:hypothetical protein